MRTRLAALLVLVFGTLGGARVAPAQVGVSDSEIVIGCSAATSGPNGFVGEEATKLGVDLYVKALNAAGGIHGRKLRTVFHDDGGSSETALANTRKLVEQDRVFAIVAPQGTRSVVATLDYLEREKVPLLFPAQGSPVARGRKYVVSGMTLFDRQSRLMIDYLVGPRHLRKLAALYQDDDYGAGFVAFIEKDLGRHGLRLVATEPVKRGMIDVRTQMAALRAKAPEAVLLVTTPGAAVQAMKERLRLGWKDTVMVAVGPLADERYLSLAGTAADGVEGLVLWPDPVTSELPGVKKYREHLVKYFPRTAPTRPSLAGYVAAMLFAEGAGRAGRALTRDTLITSLESLRRWDSGILPPISIGPDHETQKHALWGKLHEGRFKALTDWLGAE